MRFLIFGAGGIGGYFGAKLACAGEDVWFMARGKHLEAIKSRGLNVNSAQEHLHVAPDKFASNVADAGKADVVLFCVKSYDTENAARQMIPALKKDSVVICLQNGIDNEEKIRKIIPMGTVYGGAAYIYSTVTAPGEISRFEGPAKIVFGPLDNKLDDRSHQIHQVFQKAGVNADLSPSIEIELWKKFIFITGASGVTALTRLTLGEILANPETRALLRSTMEETMSVARAKHIPLDNYLIDSFFDTLQKFRNDTRSSLYYDLANEKPMEVEALAGTVVREAKQLKIPTPIQNTIYASLLPYHLKHLKNIQPPR
jgi:2-dehydropantoate 2-reductase